MAKFKPIDTTYCNCYDEYINVKQTRKTIKVTFSPWVMDAIQEYILKQIAQAIEEECGFTHEAGPMIEWGDE